VDDERSFREAIRNALEDVSACALAENGEEALKLAEDPAVEAVLLDLRLPGGSGVEVLSELRQRRPALQVIVLAEPSDQPLVIEALRRGASDYLAKPLHEEELRLAVGRALRGTRLATRWDLLRGRLLRLREVFAELDEGLRGVPRRERLEALAGPAVSLIGGVLGAARASLLVGRGGELRVAAIAGAHLAAADLPPLSAADCVAGLAFGAEDVLRIEDVARDPRCAGRPRPGRYATGSALLAPLRVAGSPFGVLCVADPHLGRPFGEEDASLLALISAQVGVLLEGAGESREPDDARARPLDGDPEEAQRVELAREVCEAMVREVEPEPLLQAALAPIADAFDAVVSLYLADGRAGRLVLEAQCERGARADRATLPRDRGLTGLVAQTGRLVAALDPQGDARFDPEADTAADGRSGPLICLPLVVRGKVLGLVRILPREGQAVSARTAELIAPALSAAVRNVLLYRSLLESLEDVARARREAGSQRSR
jgi:CheY-like chemotaxis protein